MYGVIIPIQSLKSNFYELEKLITYQLEDHRASREKFNDSIITIYDTPTILQISDRNMSWCFRIPGDKKPDPMLYHFMGNLLVEIYPDLERLWIDNIFSMEKLENLQKIQFEAMSNEPADISKFLKGYTSYECLIPKTWMNEGCLENLIQKITTRFQSINEENDMTQEEREKNIEEENKERKQQRYCNAFIIIQDVSTH